MPGTRDRIISATNELFRLRGYHGTSLSQISEAAEATTGSIYHFFPGGKEALTIAVITSTGEVYRELFELIAAEASNPRAAFDDFFTGAAEVLESSDFLDPCPIGTVARETASISDPIRRAAQDSFESWIGAASRQLAACGLDQQTAHELAVVFVATLEGSFVLSRTQRSAEPMRAAAHAIDALIGVAHLEAGNRRTASD